LPSLIRSKWDGLLIVRRPGKATVLAAVMVALMAIIGTVSPAVAHGNQHYKPAADVSSFSNLDNVQAWAGVKLSLTAHKPSEQIGTHIPDKRSESWGQHDCCAGGALCHASATSANELIPFCYLDGEKVLPPTSSKKRMRLPSGLERPPRSVLPV
jgi:hypothetical protein